MFIEENFEGHVRLEGGVHADWGIERQNLIEGDV